MTRYILVWLFKKCFNFRFEIRSYNTVAYIIGRFCSKLRQWFYSYVRFINKLLRTYAFMLSCADNASNHLEDSITIRHNNGSIMTCDFRQDEIINEQFTRCFFVLYCCIYFHNCKIALFKFELFSNFHNAEE